MPFPNRQFQKVKQSFWFFVLILFFFLSSLRSGKALPLISTILDSQNKPIGLAHIYIDYVELLELDGTSRGKVSFVKTQSGFEIFVVRDDEKNSWVGRASFHRLYDKEGKLLAFYDWTSFWSYVYAEDGKRLGKLKCLAFRGICAAGAASFLSGLLERN